MIDHTIWLLLSLSTLSPTGYDVERYRSLPTCESYMKSIHEANPAARPVCIHSTEPWRTVNPYGPSKAERRARDRERQGKPTFNDPWLPKE